MYRDHIRCYGCGFAVGRRLDSLAYLLGCTPKEAQERAGDFIGLPLAPTPPALPPLSLAVVAAYQGLLWGRRSQRLEWFRARGLTDGTIKAFRLGHDGTRFCIPVYDKKGVLVTIRYRSDPAYATQEYTPPKYMGMKGRNGLLLYGSWLLQGDEEWAVIVEGELDAIRLWQEGVPALSPTNGAGNLAKIAPLLPDHIHHLYIASDQDEAGNLGAEQLQNAVTIETHRLTWPRTLGKDITELLITDRSYLDGQFKEREYAA